ncbi:MFS transporter [Brevibacterium sp. UCMA 11754]|uniref:MFS transporter n=1 Tax=Brevibacterium sp. UCMA 11754 TaxID=2749198 RepID=UPI001F2D8AAE|nr:aromatic acid/H+ symport family MFS transporter [Brevibacterium sp. UCMA 11754]
MMSPVSLNSEVKTSGRGLATVMILSWLAVFFDGIDTFMYGATIPSMTADAGFGMTDLHAGNIGSYATFGMLIGALCAGVMTDAIGRRRGIIICTIIFSVASAGCAIAPAAGTFGVFRTIAGVGLGGLLPTAIAMVSEFASDRRRNLSIGILMTAHQAGGIIAGFLGITVLQTFGWRSMYWVGVIPLILLVPLIFALLPESLSFLVAKGKYDKAQLTAQRLGMEVPAAPAKGSADKGSFLRNLGQLFQRRNGAITLLFWAASFGGLLLVYGVSTWLPKLMAAEGYALGSSLSFLIVINLGGIFGMLVAGRTSDSLGAVKVSMLWFLVTAVAVFLLSIKMPLALTYVVVFIAGFFLFSAQTMVYAAVAFVFPTRTRGSAIGWTTGMGRFGAVFGPWMGGQLLALGLHDWGFGAFAAFAILSMIMLLAILFITKSTGGRAVDYSPETSIGASA